ncbi:hypothetical protein [Paludifilum halophilum]|uniref:Uncharacterized protein n=1 Tax=Paludifilum halophilum TaxID=1642702 RepID=A0A235B575_9BACL|nr:hypothetical protein [Paludifilum halophilum]OYD07433.1 hypothetical protein CHM34_11045 [Paludifilum halophilum]
MRKATGEFWNNRGQCLLKSMRTGYRYLRIWKHTGDGENQEKVKKYKKKIFSFSPERQLLLRGGIYTELDLLPKRLWNKSEKPLMTTVSQLNFDK